jgi:predicted NACHT family NTPase
MHCPVDGIDEVFDPTLREVVVTDIHRFTNDYPHVQVIATSRWLGYKPDPVGCRVSALHAARPERRAN